jgi:hypothetical protein
MRCIRASKEAVILQLEARERRLFIDVLSKYPVVPAAYQPLSRGLKDLANGDDQALLNDALAEQRAALQQQLQQWLRTPNRFRRVQSGYNFTLRRTEAEWLLQILNDIRVGHWLLLGSPGEMLDVDDLDALAPEMHHAWAVMELSGMFQMIILQALEAQPSS